MDFSLMMEYGPKLIQFGIITMTVYHAWQRNVLKTIACATAAVVTFILGW